MSAGEAMDAFEGGYLIEGAAKCSMCGGTARGVHSSMRTVGR